MRYLTVRQIKLMGYWRAPVSSPARRFNLPSGPNFFVVFSLVISASRWIVLSLLVTAVSFPTSSADVQALGELQATEEQSTRGRTNKKLNFFFQSIPDDDLD